MPRTAENASDRHLKCLKRPCMFCSLQVCIHASGKTAYIVDLTKGSVCCHPCYRHVHRRFVKDHAKPGESTVCTGYSRGESAKPFTFLALGSPVKNIKPLIEDSDVEFTDDEYDDSDDYWNYSSDIAEDDTDEGEESDDEPILRKRKRPAVSSGASSDDGEFKRLRRMSPTREAPVIENSFEIQVFDE